uniref:Uncharacterized protein n=1 Tax=Pithovirus LCPAC302 TaxID=2506593 RepID=A0A481Z6W3_9VIRU|nr:MAG: hypothetical protein LCPAC302_02340 [Pithovirus LCPAC302]
MGKLKEEFENKERSDAKVCDKYNCDAQNKIRAVYLIGSVLWVALTLVLDLWKDGEFLTWFFLILPLVIFAINYLSLGEFTCSMEDQMFRGNFLSFGFLVAIILINWNSPLGYHDKTEFFKILVAAFILLMISLVDIWVGKRKMAIVKHIKTSLHTASLALLALALYLYYTYQRDQYTF